MSQAIRELQPQEVWKNFADLNAVPRPSKKEERVIAFMKQFGENLGLETMEDTIGNVIIRKPATPGMEDRKMVVMQSHLDMVHQKNSDTVFDFDTQGIEMFVDGDWVKARGTTLGADNGLGVATIMAVLESTTIANPAIEALFTIDEETGMTGAMGLEGGILQGDILLNLDTEEDDEIGVGCAGGVDVTAKGTYQQEPATGKTFQILVKGLQGGHSGMDIIKGLGNANKLMNRILFALTNEVRIAAIDGGSLRNAIPRESTAMVVIDPAHMESAAANFDTIKKALMDEFRLLEPEMSLEMAVAGESAETVMSRDDQSLLLKALQAALNGVFRMSPAIEGLVETSNNIAKVVVGDGAISAECLTRSSVESSKTDLAHGLKCVFELAGYTVSMTGDYPGWAPNMDSPILKVMEQLYVELNHEKPHLAACHAGLECGILGRNYPQMDMISFGPNIKGAHSPDERASISSTQKFWNFVLEILKNIPKK